MLNQSGNDGNFGISTANSIGNISSRHIFLNLSRWCLEVRWDVCFNHAATNCFGQEHLKFSQSDTKMCVPRNSKVKPLGEKFTLNAWMFVTKFLAFFSFHFSLSSVFFSLCDLTFCKTLGPFMSADWVSVKKWKKSIRCFTVNRTFKKLKYEGKRETLPRERLNEMIETLHCLRNLRLLGI